jgi:uncharacterized protein
MLEFIEVCEDDYIVYFSNIIRVFSINLKTKNLIESYINDNVLNELLDKKIIDFINEDSRNIENKLNNSLEKRIIERLVIHVSNDCNLRCKYCYADDGNYGLKVEMLTKNNATAIVNYFLTKYEVRSIQFFGGEPLMNYDVIKHICDYIKENYAQDNNNNPLKFGIITNGTIINDYILKLFSVYDFQVTVSVDGTRESHDSNRVDVKGKGSYDRVKQNIERLQRAGINPNVESTYSMTHINHQESVFNSCKNMYEKLGVKSVHMVPVATSDGNVIKRISPEFILSVDEIMSKGKYYYNSLGSIIERISTKERSNNICSALSGTLAVNVKGDIYPCFMMNGSEEFLVGNVISNPQLDIIKTDIFQYFKEQNTYNNKCESCFLRNICFGCLGENVITAGNPFVFNEDKCNMLREMYKKVMINMVKLSRNSNVRSGYND